MRGEGVYISIRGRNTVAICDRREGREEIYIYPLSDLLRFRWSYFRMERQR